MLARGQGVARAVVRGVFGGQAWSLGRVAGIPIAIDRSWILIFLLITFSLGGSFAAERPDWPVAARWGAALSASLLFFASIVLHELGHSLTAQPLGVRVRSITLFLFGGLAAPGRWSVRSLALASWVSRQSCPTDPAWWRAGSAAST